MKHTPFRRALLTAIRQSSIPLSEEIIHKIKLHACISHNGKWSQCRVKKIERLAPGEQGDGEIRNSYYINDFRGYMQYGHSRSKSMQCCPVPIIETHYVEVYYNSRHGAGYGVNAETGAFTLWID